MEFKIEKRRITEIKEYPNNPRDHSDLQVEKIANSIKEFGFTVPIIVKDKFIIAGHGRFLAAKKLGLQEIPGINREDLTEAQANAFRIADNRITMDSNWDMDKLGSEFVKLLREDFDLSKIGFNKDEIEFFIKKAQSEETNVNYGEEWKGMPEFNQQDESAFRMIKINFMDQEGVDAFAKLIGQNISDKTRYLYYPKQEARSDINIRYEEDE